MHLASSVLCTPIGRYALEASPRGLTRVVPAPRARGGAHSSASAADPRARAVLAAARAAFDAYFAGRPNALVALPLDPSGTPFQRLVWRALRQIPPGATASYGEIARRIGRPRAARAVGGACHRNPVAIAIPCHRAIGADGDLVGYAGGLRRKRRLLALEIRVA